MVKQTYWKIENKHVDIRGTTKTTLPKMDSSQSSNWVDRWWSSNVWAGSVAWIWGRVDPVNAPQKKYKGDYKW